MVSARLPYVARRDQHDGNGDCEQDRHPWRAPRGVHDRKYRGYDTLAGHAVHQARRHDHIHQRGIADRQQGDYGEQFGRKCQARNLDHLKQRPGGRRQGPVSTSMVAVKATAA